MKRDNINYLVVGTVVLAAFTLMLYVLYRLTGGVGESDHYYVDYANVGGLSEGTPVTYQGFKLGTVTTIEPLKREGRTFYRVNIVVRDGWQIPIDSVAQIYSEGLLAQTVINIEEGRSDQYLTPGSELQGRQGADVFAAINSVAADASGLMSDSIRPLLDNLNARVTSLGDQIQGGIPLVVDDLRALIATLQQSADRIPRMLDQVAESKVTRIVDNTEAISSNLRKLSEGLLETRLAADRLLVDSRGTISENREDLRRSVVALRQSLETVAAYTEAILHNLEGSSRNMNEFSRQIRDNPGLLLGSKPPKEVGVGREQR